MDEYKDLLKTLDNCVNMKAEEACPNCEFDGYGGCISMLLHEAAEALSSIITMNEYLNELNKKLINELEQTMNLLEYPKEETDGA